MIVPSGFLHQLSCLIGWCVCVLYFLSSRMFVLMENGMGKKEMRWCCQLPVAQNQDPLLLYFFFISVVLFCFLVLEHPLSILLPSFLLLVLSIKRTPIPASDFCLNRFLLIELEINFYGGINLIVFLGRSDFRTIPCYISPHNSLSWIV